MAYTIHVVVKDHIGSPVNPEVLKTFVTDVCIATLSAEACGKGEVGVRITDDEEIRDLNRTYRHVDRETDVLSFPMADGFPTNNDGIPLLLGDIVLSWPRVQEQARRYGHTLKRELAFLVVHGLLHLLGYTHDDGETTERMRAREEAVLERLSLKRDGSTDF